jgi:hypothetical protein
MARMTEGASMLPMTRMVPWQFGQTRGSTSYIFWIKRAQFRRKVFSSPCDSRMQGIASSLPSFCRFPREALLYQPYYAEFEIMRSSFVRASV